MRKIFTILNVLLFAAGVFAATEQAWYNDVTSITANGQYYIYSVNGKAFMQAGQAQVKAITTSNYTNASTFKFKISSANEGYVTNGSYYLKSYMELGGTGSNSGPICTKQLDNGTKIIWTLMNSGEYWNIHGSYNAWFADRYAALKYEDSAYEGFIEGSGVNYSKTKDTQTGTKFRWYLVSQEQLDRHFAIYFFDAYKETVNIAQYENLVPAAYYTALQTAYNKTFDVQNTAHSADVVNAAKADLETLYNGAVAIKTAYETAKGAINALEAVEDKGEDFAEVTKDINDANTALEAAMTVAAVEASVAGLKAIDPITFSVTTFMAGQAIGTPASTVASRAITYEAANKKIINAEGKAMYKGTTKLTATAAATDAYYKFVRSANVTVNAENTEAQETKTIVYGASESWHGKDLSAYAVGSHTLTFDTLNIYGGAHKTTLTLTVNKIETLNVPVELEFCQGDSAQYRGEWYKAASTVEVPAEGATRDTLYVVTVTVHPVYAFHETGKAKAGEDYKWHGLEIKTPKTGTFDYVDAHTTVNGCDSTYYLALTVTKADVLEVPVELEFCQGDSAEYRGEWYKAASTVEVPAEGATRDTLYVVKVTVNPVYAFHETGKAKVDEGYNWHGMEIKTPKTGTFNYEDAHTTVKGCDSIYHLTLTVTKADVVEIPVELAFCTGDSAQYRDKWYKEATTDPVYAEGETADTIYNVTVTVLQPTTGTDEKTIVYGAQETWNGIDLSEYMVGMYKVPFVTTNIAGCDSTVTLSLKVEKQETLEVPVALSFCEGGSEIFRGVEYSEAGTVKVPAEGATRDTLYIVNVTVLQPSATSEEMTITAGDDVVWNGIALKDSTVGVHAVIFDTLNVAGCDSTVTLTLTVEKQKVLELAQALEFCEGDTVEYRDIAYYEAGSDTIKAEGAIRDTIIVVTATVWEKSYTEIFITDTVGNIIELPEGEWIVGDKTISGTYELQEADTVGFEYIHYGETEHGCEAVTKLIVTVESRPIIDEGVENVQVDKAAQKFFRNGVIYIRRGETLYGLDGKRIE